jgi:hypothetical protein
VVAFREKWALRRNKKMSEPTEPFAILDFFCTDVAVEDLGNGVRGLVFSSPHGGSGHVSQQNAVRIITPAACLLGIRQKLMPHADQVLYELIGQNNHTSQ